MQTILFRVFVVVGIAALALIAALGLRHQFSEFHEFVQRTPKWQRAFLALLAAVFIAYGSVKTNTPPMMMVRPPVQQTVTPADISRG